jgi:hypothetical protein
MTNNQQLATRRHFLASQSMNLTGLATAWLMARESRGKSPEPKKPQLEPLMFDARPKPPPHPARATAMISLWMQGGPSQMDMFDPKPELNRLDGQPFPGEIKYDNAAQASSKVFGSPWKFRKHGECGMELSELLPGLSKVVDDICLIRSMHTGVNNHGQSIRALNSGDALAGQPSVGSWLTYALGSEADNLPAYLSLIDPGQLPVLGVENWSNGWLPAIYQGTVIRPQEPRIFNLDSPPKYRSQQERYLGFLQRLNERHAARHPRETELAARMEGFSLAARMQTSAKEALDLSQETEETKRLYGLDQKETADFGTRCLIARRLVERGVRFVQVFTQNQFWDHHNSIRTGLPNSCKKIDQPSAALVHDLKRRGLLDSTVVHWGGEMGRLPVIQNDAGPNKIGRDHNTYGFSSWVAGGGFRAGHIHGATDEFGHRAIEGTVHHYDYHATLFHLFGLDAKDVQFSQNNQDRGMINVEKGKVVEELLA